MILMRRRAAWRLRLAAAAVSCLVSSIQSDPTSLFCIGECKSSAPPAVPSVPKGVEHVRTPELPQSLASTLADVASGGIVIATMSNFGGWEILKNWHCSMQAIGLDKCPPLSSTRVCTRTSECACARLCTCIGQVALRLLAFIRMEMHARTM